MYAFSKTQKNSKERGAVFKLVGEFLLVFAVFMVIAQPFAAHAAPDLQVICSEQGVLMVDANGVEQDQECPDCAQCDECTTPSVRLQATLVDQECLLSVAQIETVAPLANCQLATALIHSQMLRGPPSITSELHMLFQTQLPSGLVGEFS